MTGATSNRARTMLAYATTWTSACKNQSRIKSSTSNSFGSPVLTVTDSRFPAVAVLSGSGGKSHDQTAHIAKIASVVGPDIFIRLAPSDKSCLRATQRRSF